MNTAAVRSLARSLTCSSLHRHRSALPQLRAYVLEYAQGVYGAASAAVGPPARLVQDSARAYLETGDAGAMLDTLQGLWVDAAAAAARLLSAAAAAALRACAAGATACNPFAAPAADAATPDCLPPPPPL